MAKHVTLIALLPYLFCTRTAAVVSYRTTSTTVSPSNENANNECGITSNYYTDDTNSKMSNGAVTLPGQWPWVVAIYNLINDEFINKFMCAGSILTTRHVLTGMLRK